MYKDTQEDRNKTIEFLKEQGMYNHMLSTKTIQDYHDVYHRAIESKQLTIEELREQFEKIYNDFYLEKQHGHYVFSAIQAGWKGYIKCARDNNLIKE